MLESNFSSSFYPSELPIAHAAAESSVGISANRDSQTSEVQPAADSYDKPPQQPEESSATSTAVLFDFNDREPLWYPVNDDVMGGISRSSVRIDSNLQRLIFSGDLSLENNGGFASIRSQWIPYDLRVYDGIVLRVRGDGNTYRFRIRTETTGSEIAYTALFTTKANAWQEVTIPFTEMMPLYRGFIVPGVGPLNPASIRSFGLMLADKQQGEFTLEIDRIHATTVDKNNK